MRKWIARKRPKLLPRHASARLAWALEQKDWTVEQWRKYIWSDECSVECSKGAGAKWVSPEVVKEALADALNEIWNEFPSHFWKVCIPLCLVE